MGQGGGTVLALDGFQQIPLFLLVQIGQLHGQKEYIKLPSEKVGKYLNKLRTPQQKEDFILKALAFYAHHLERHRSSRDGR